MAFAVPLPAELRAEGLHLRALEDNDWRLEHDLSRVPDVTRWTFYPVEMDEKTARRRIARIKERHQERVTARYAVIVDGVALGTAGMACVEEAEPEVFYALLPSGRGARSGYAVSGTAEVLVVRTWVSHRRSGNHRGQWRQRAGCRKGGVSAHRIDVG